ncbi:lss [Symbiodinium microadriaticum]|nr:lss [Symbiodinium microadriaticum]
MQLLAQDSFPHASIAHVPTTDEEAEDILADTVVVTSTITTTTTTSVMVPIQSHVPTTDEEAEDTVVLTSATTKTTTTVDMASLPSPSRATEEGSEARSYGPRMERLLEALVAVGNAAAGVEESIHHEAKVPMKQSFIEAPTEESSTEAAVEHEDPDFETKPGYKCMMYAKAWCTYPEVNPGDEYRKNGKVKCCTEIDHQEAPRKTNPMDAFVDDNPLKSKGFGTKAQWNVLDEEADSRQEEDEEEELEEMTPTTPVPRDEEKVALCGEFEFQSETFLRRGKPVSVCRNKDTGRFSKALCCK